MEENVALDSTKQKQFVKSIKGIKKLIKKNDSESKAGDGHKKTKGGKVAKRKRKERGLVYLGHIPHGFYEHEMTQYFKQFGVVTNARVIRSKHTGNSKGYAFVEFKEPAVAQIVAETMNNYLMGKRLIKAEYIPPEKIRPHAMRKHWNPVNNPGNELRLKMKKEYNANKDEKEEIVRAKKLLSNLAKTEKKLKAMGIDFYSFAPVDVPEELLQNIKKEDSKEKDTDKKKAKKVKIEKSTVADGNIKPVAKNKKGKVQETKVEEKVKVEKNKKKDVVNEENQKQKNQKLKEAGVKPAENFIKIQQESEDESDSMYEFDSDEYEKMINNEDEFSSNESEDDDDDGDNSKGDVASPPKKGKKNNAVKKSAPLLPVKKEKKIQPKQKPLPQIKNKIGKNKNNKNKKSNAVTLVPKFEKKSTKKPKRS